MRPRTIAVAALAIAAPVCFACVADEPSGGQAPDAGSDGAQASDANASTDSAADAGCLARPFSHPAPLPGVNTTGREWDGRLSGDELSIFFSSDRPTDAGRPDGFFEPFDIYEARRATPTGTFANPSLLSVNSPTAGDFHPTISSDNRSLYFQTTRGGKHEVWGATRTTAGDVFGAPMAITAANAAPANGEPFVVGNTQILYFAQGQDIDGDLNIMRLDIASGGPPVPVDNVNSSASDIAPFVTPDELTIYLGSQRGGGSYDIYVSHRNSTGEPFPQPTILNEVSSSADDAPSWVSADGCRMILWSDRQGGFDIYESVRQ